MGPRRGWGGIGGGAKEGGGICAGRSSHARAQREGFEGGWLSDAGLRRWGVAPAPSHSRGGVRARGCLLVKACSAHHD